MTKAETTTYLVTHTLTRNGEAPEETHRETFTSREMLVNFLQELGVGYSGSHGNSTPAHEEGTFSTAMAGAMGVIRWSKIVEPPVAPAKAATYTVEIFTKTGRETVHATAEDARYLEDLPFRSEAVTATRVHLDGHPAITGTIVDGDEWCDKVTVQWNEGRSFRIHADRLVRTPAPAQFLDRSEQA